MAFYPSLVAPEPANFINLIQARSVAERKARRYIMEPFRLTRSGKQLSVLFENCAFHAEKYFVGFQSFFEHIFTTTISIWLKFAKQE